MGQIDQTLFDSNVANTVETAKELADALNTLPSPGNYPHTQDVAQAYASGRDLVHRIDRFADHLTERGGTIDQASFDSEMGVLLVAKDSLQKAEDTLQDSYTEFTSAANAVIMDVEALTAFMTEPPAGQARATKGRRVKFTEPDQGEDVLGVSKEHKRFMGFGKGKKK